MTGKSVHSRGTLRLAAARGFSLVEMLVAIAVFLIISSAAFTLFNNQQQLLSQQQGLAGLNIGVRNALTQIQMDAVNGANGLVLGAYAPAWPVGAKIVNQTPSTACNTGAPNFQYGTTCFDSLIIILADRLTPTCNLAANLNTSTSTTVNVVPTTGTAAQYAGNFHTGDELMVVSGAGVPFTTITLTANGTASGSNIALSYTSTSTAGINPKDAPCPPAGTGLCLTTDALPAYLGVNYYQSSPTTDWIIRLAPITYYVDTTNANDPKLMRQVSGGAATQVMDQIVSFKVGAALVNDTTGNYYYKASAANNASGGYNSDFTLVRSVRVSLLARTPPNATLSYRNQFDGGPYQVLGASVVVNPRNMSMNDQ
ncbi:MAG: PilW family protein [Terriglobia bacterium]|jgi:prepilin-type N-terminal cleavage/methylation domain-containing protein